MALVFEKVKICGVKIIGTVCGVPSIGNGVVYSTPSNCDYVYILTAKHIFQEDSKTLFDVNKVSKIEIFYSDYGKLKKYQELKKAKFNETLITFIDDFAIVIVEKRTDVIFPQILVSDVLAECDEQFFSWGVFGANQDELHRFNWNRNDPEMNRFQTDTPLISNYLPGLSGAGVFHLGKPILFGVISKYPNENFQNNTIDCSHIDFEEVNEKLASVGRVRLDTQTSKQKREINKQIVYIKEAVVNEVTINLELARKRLKTDIEDDWYHDPLKYIDLLNQDYIFRQFEPYFDNSTYSPSLAERFFVPKKQFTLRQALILPFLDRIMYMAVVGVIANRLDEAMIPSVYSARFNHFSDTNLNLGGVEQWKKMKYVLNSYAQTKDHDGTYKYGCVIEIDLLNFYDNIDKEMLYDKVKRVCITHNEKKAASLLNKMLNGFSKSHTGLPQNSDASALLASFYLNQVDTFMVHRVGKYVRFMDDIRIFCLDKYEARNILQTFELELRRCHLSVNSQKTKILSFTKGAFTKDEIPRNYYSEIFEIDLNQISRWRSSKNYVYRLEAFHKSMGIVIDSLLSVDKLPADDFTRRLTYCLNTIALLSNKKIDLNTIDSNFERAINLTIASLKDQPWITPQLCKVLSLLPVDRISANVFEEIEHLLMDERHNVYSYQTYQLWLVLSKHKYDSESLKKYAVTSIEKNDNTNVPATAAMIIYICSVNPNYRRVILRKVNDGFSQEYFQSRVALVCLRSFATENIRVDNFNSTLQYAHEFTNKNKDKDLVFIQGADEEGSAEENYIEQLYSL